MSDSCGRFIRVIGSCSSAASPSTPLRAKARRLAEAVEKEGEGEGKEEENEKRAVDGDANGAVVPGRCPPDGQWGATPGVLGTGLGLR
jgi:hypothetical protein